MKFFEELIERGAKLADEAVKVGKEAFDQTKDVAGDMMEKGKKKVNKLQLEADKKEAFRKLGEVVYLQHNTGEANEDLVKQYLGEIVEIEASLALLESDAVNENTDYTVEEQPAVEDTLKEELCELKEDVKSEFNEVIEEVKEIFGADKDKKVCSACGEKADDADIFCRGCGNKLD